MTDIVLKDRNGNSIEYPGVNHIKVKTTDGATKDFIARTPVETSVKLDFADGDMEVTPEAEELFSKVNIPVPATLIPENIAEGVDIAGIIGILQMGSSAKIATGTVIGNNGTVTVDHKLGVVPDLVLVRSGGAPSTYTTNHLSHAICFSNALFTMSGYGLRQFAVKSNGNTYTITNFAVFIDGTSVKCPVHSANENSMALGSDTADVPLRSGMSYTWIAIGGLT